MRTRTFEWRIQAGDGTFFRDVFNTRQQARQDLSFIKQDINLFPHHFDSKELESLRKARVVKVTPKVVSRG